MPKTCNKNKTQPKPKTSSSSSCKTKVAICGNTKVEYLDTDSDTESECCCSKIENSLTKIIAEVNIGFGNTLYIRGAGCGLNWEKGIALKNHDTNFWALELPQCTEDFEYKLLINDKIWNTGENFVAHRNQQNIVKPKF